MGVSPVKVSNTNIVHVLNRSQTNNSNISSSNNCNFNTPPDNNKPPSNKYNIEKLRIFHQNIRGLNNKVDELTTHWLNQCPHVLCITEHHLKDFEINNIRINNYKLGGFYCKYICT